MSGSTFKPELQMIEADRKTLFPLHGQKCMMGINQTILQDQ